MAEKKLKKPAPRNLDKEMGTLGGLGTTYSAQVASAQAAAASAANQAMIDQALGATETIAGKLDNASTGQARAALDQTRGQLKNVGDQVWKLEALGQQAIDDTQGTFIEGELEQQAIDELQLGRQLSPEQERAAQQSARSGYAARGMAVGAPSALAEILNRDAYATQRQDARRNFAGQTNQMLTGNRLQRLGQAGSLLGQATGTRLNMGQQNLGLAQGYIGADPFQRALGSNIPIASQGAAANMGGNVGQAFGQVLDYGSDLYNTNFNADWSNYLGQRNALEAQRMGQQQIGAASAAGRQSANGAMMSAGIGAAGLAGTAALGAGATAAGTAVAAAGTTGLFATAGPAIAAGLLAL